MPVFRKNTDDEAFWNACFEHDDYQCPQFASEDAVIDLGLSIGAFTAKAHQRGSRNIWAYEACPDNFAIAVQNANLEGAHLFHKAVVGTFRPKRMDFPVGNNSFFIPEHAPMEVETTTLDEIIEQVGRPIRFLKIDVEGSEWEILYTCKSIDRIQEIKGEYHQPCRTWHALKQIEELPTYDWLTLKTFLEEHGFVVDILPPSMEISAPDKAPILANTFHAWRA